MQHDYTEGPVGRACGPLPVQRTGYGS